MALTLLTVTIPNGVHAGDYFCVDVAGQEFDVMCPDGCASGENLEIELLLQNEEAPQNGESSPPAGDFVDVVVPQNVAFGEEFLVQLESGESFYVVTPIGCAPGELLTVQVPPGSTNAIDENMRPPSPNAMSSPCARDSPARPAHSSERSRRPSRDVCASYIFSRPGHSRHASRDDLPSFHKWAEEENERAGITGSEFPFDSYIAPQRPASPPRHAALPQAPTPEPRADAQQTLGRFFFGAIVEVERNDGSKSRCSVEDHEDGGNTYSVRLLDGTGRCKHFVEDNELHAIRCGTFAAGRRVLLSELGAASAMLGTIDAFDADTCTYTVQLLDGRFRSCITDEEISEVR